MSRCLRFSLEWIVFICGGATMILELTGSRLLAPYLGTSTIVWTGLIGVILGCLSVGYWWGGSLSDKNPERRVLARLIFTAAVFVGAIALIGPAALLFFEKHVSDLRLSAVVTAAVLFGPASVFLGTVLPYAVRLKTVSVETAGATAGALCAISTVGSIVGTFFAGYYLLAYLGNTHILILICVLLFLASALAHFSNITTRTVVAVVLLAVACAADAAWAAVMGPGFVDKNTAYNRVWIYDQIGEAGSRPIRMMRIANEHSSAMFLDGDEMVFDYTKYYRLAKHLKPTIRRALMIGGAGYSYPKAFLTEHPQALMDVVEIDPGLTELAKRYFRLREDPRLRIFHEDGRTFLNHAVGKYDVIYGDAFKSIFSIPHQLATVESARRIRELLEPDGVVLINVISALEGDRAKFLLAERSTFMAVFPQVYVVQTDPTEDPKHAQNLILVAMASEKKPKFYSSDRQLNAYLRNLVYKDLPAARILTDDFAPVEYFAIKMLDGRPRPENPLRRSLREFLESRGKGKRS